MRLESQGIANVVARTFASEIVDQEFTVPQSTITASASSQQITESNFAAAEAVFVGSGSHNVKRSRRLIAPALLGGGLTVAIVTVLAIAYRGSDGKWTTVASSTDSASYYGAISPVQKCLAPQYADANGDMLADPVRNPAIAIKPDALVVAHYEGDYEEEPRVNWEAFKSHLEGATGKKVVLQEYLHTTAEVESIAAGKIHIVAPHAADVPCLVNNAGMIPVAALGTKDGPNGNCMVIAASPDSNINSLDDLKGKTLTCTRPHSITGYRAAVTILAQKADMRVDSDYSVYLSDGQARSIRGIKARWFEIAAISRDKLQWALAEGVIDDTKYRTIYESEVIPRLTVGHIHNLEPQLAAKISEAILSFDNERTAGDEWTAPPMRFFSVDYKRDFKFVRKMDDSFDPRCGKILTAQVGG